MAREHDLHDHAGRAYANLISEAVREHDYELSARYLSEGLAYTDARDLDSYGIYLRGWAARYHFEQGKKTPRKKSLEKLKDNVRAKTPRKSGTSLERTIKRLNPTLRGWWGYFRHCERWVHEKLDGWIRRRLRAMLQRFAKKRGTGAGFANARWPNAFFADAGLFSLTAAWTGANRSR